jgi:hypothetical protein
MELVLLLNAMEELASLLSAMWKNNKNTAICKARRDPSAEPDHADSLILRPNLQNCKKEMSIV